MHIYDKDGAVRYDQILDQPVYKYYINKKFRLIKNWFNANSVLLDVGCGTGIYVTSLAKQCKMIVGMDVSSEMIFRSLLKARQMDVDNIHFVVGDVAYCPLKSGIFDLVFSVNVFHHVSDEKTVLKGLTEKVRCCRKNGHVLAYELNPKSLGWSKNLIPMAIRCFVYFLLFPFRQQVIDNVEEGTRMVNIYELLRKTGKVKMVFRKVGGFIPTYCPKFLFRIFVLLERAMEAIPLIRSYGAHVVVVGEVQ